MIVGTARYDNAAGNHQASVSGRQKTDPTSDGTPSSRLERELGISCGVKDFTWGVPTWLETAAIAAIAATATAVVPYIQALATELAKKQ